MRKSYKEDETQEMIVLRVPKNLAIDAQKRASVMMISKSAVCRTALLEYLTPERGTSSEVLPQY